MQGHFESHFGHNFGRVRVHDDAMAAASAHAMNATAYTCGTDIVFGRGRYAPGSREGHRLLAHELAHVVQQEGGSPLLDCPGGAEGLEREAQCAAEAVANGASQVLIAAGRPVPCIQMAEEAEASPISLPKERVTMPYVGRGSKRPHTERGYLRDESYFWKEYQRRWAEQLSHRNRELIKEGSVPRVDEQWVRFHPEHTAYLHEELHHHHIGQGAEATPLALSQHRAYSVYHAQRQTVAKPGEAAKPLKPLPTREWTKDEVRRHVGAGRLRGGGIDPAKVAEPPAIPLSSELAGVPPEQLKPVSPEEVAELQRVDPETGRVRPQSAAPQPAAESASGVARPAPPEGRVPGAGRAEPAKTGAKPKPVLAIGEPSSRETAARARTSSRTPRIGPVGSTFINIGAGVARDLLTSWLHDKILESVEEMPKPTIREARLWDPGGMRERSPLDLVASNLPQMADDFDSGRVHYTFQVVQAWYAVDAMLFVDDKEHLLDQFADAVLKDVSELFQARSNVKEAQALAPKMREAMQAAEDLLAMAESGAGIAVMFYGGLSVEEISRITNNLRWFAASHRNTLAALDRLEGSLEKAIDANAEILEQIDEMKRKVRAAFQPKQEPSPREEFIKSAPAPG